MARDRRPIVVRPSQRRQRSRWQKERARQRSVIVAGVIAILFILAIPAYGYWSTFVAPPRSVVLQVDDTKYQLGYMLRYLKGITALGVEPDLSTEPFRLLQLLEENELIRRGALGKGILLEPQEVDQEIRNRILGSSESLANVSPDQLEREFKEKYRQYLSTLRLSQKEYREMVEADLLRTKLTGQLGQEVPSVAKSARLSWIVVPTAVTTEEGGTEDSGQIDEVSQRLQRGEEFAALAEEFSLDRTSAVNGGDLGWVPEGAYSPLDDTIFSLQPGDTSEAVIVDENAYFLKVAEVDEARAIEPAMIDRLKGVAFQVWLAQERGNHRIKACFGGGSAGGSCDWQYDWLVKRMREPK